MNNKIISMLDALDYSSLRQFPELSSLWLLDTWYNLRGLVQLVDSPIVPYLDFKSAVRQETDFISDDLRKEVSDVLYSVPVQGVGKSEAERETLPVYVLLEHQSTVDSIMAYRLHSYMSQIWDRNLSEHKSKSLPLSEWRLPTVIGIVFYTGDRRWSVPLSLRELSTPRGPFDVYVPDCRFLLLDVKHTSAETLTGPDHPLGWGLTVLQQEHESEAALRSAIVSTVERLLSLGPDEENQRDKVLSYLYMLIFGRRPREEREGLVQVIHDLIEDKSLRAKEESKVQTIAQSLFEDGMKAGEQRGIEIGEQRGIEIGEQRGEVRAKREVTLKTLHARFDDVPDELTRKIERMRSLIRLDAIFTQALEAKSIEDIEW